MHYQSYFLHPVLFSEGLDDLILILFITALCKIVTFNCPIEICISVRSLICLHEASRFLSHDQSERKTTESFRRPGCFAVHEKRKCGRSVTVIKKTGNLHADFLFMQDLMCPVSYRWRKELSAWRFTFCTCSTCQLSVSDAVREALHF